MTDTSLIWASEESKRELQAAMKKKAFNKAYEPPEDDIFLARRLIYWYFIPQLTMWKEEAIEAKKKVSRLTREMAGPKTDCKS